MVDLFEGKPDARQADTDIPVSCFRPRYRALTDEEKVLHDEIKNKAAELEVLFKKVKYPTCDASWYNTWAFKDLESSVMWIVKALTS